MDVREALGRELDKLPPAKQEQVLRFAASLSFGRPIGASGATLRSLAGTLDAESARQMTEAIEEECERIDSSDW